MGAKDKKQDKKNADNTETIEFELTPKQQRLFEESLATLRSLVDDLHSIQIPIREWALALTRMEEAEMWVNRGFEVLGIEEDEDDEDEDDDSEDEEDDGENNEDDESEEE